jgi:succinate-semialdehyde dehydrogenase/glutarate-semialdehyde dehydrogenase
MKVSGEEEAIRLANDSHLGLGAYVFTGDRARGRRVAQRIEVGSVMINDVIMHSGVPDMPWGGIKQSGIGVARSDRALKSLCNARHINEELVPALKKDPVWYPYSSKTLENARKVIDLLFGDSTASKAIRFFIR